MHSFSELVRPFRRIQAAVLALTGLMLLLPGSIRAQSASPDTLRLEQVRLETARLDPAISRAVLIDAASVLDERNLATSRLPRFFLGGQATWQNEVPELGLPGMSIDGPPLEQYRAQAEVDWTLYSGGRTRKEMDVASARRAEQLAGVDITTRHVMDGASETFYAVLSWGARARVLEASANALADRLAFLRVRVTNGAATSADAAALEAELIRVRQETERAEALRQAALSVLGSFVGRDLPSDTVLEIPAWTTRFSMLQGASGGQAPELVELRLRQERLQAEADVVRSLKRPQVSAFGQAGLGRPGPFNFLSSDVNSFALVGVRLRWSIMDWGQARRTRQIVEHQAAMVGTMAASTELRIQRDLADDFALEAHLSSRLADDERVVELRETVLEAAGRQLEEGALLPAMYTERMAELTAARVALETNRIERSRVRFRILSALGALPGPDVLSDSFTSERQP